MEDCIFCKIVRGEVPSSKVYEDSKVLSFIDIMPASKGHTLVIPKGHYVRFEDIPGNELEGLIKALQRVSKAVIKAVNATGYKVEIFNGESAGQAVMHAHFHIVPRYEGDGLEYQAGKNWWVPNKKLYMKGEIEKFVKKIKESLE